MEVMVLNGKWKKYRRKIKFKRECGVKIPLNIK
jgi:hypothetical protein